MDVPRTGARRRKIIRRVALALVIAGAVPLITLALSRMKPAAPGVERSTLWTGEVQRGPMVRQVRGLGTLVPEEILWIPATHEGRVDKVRLRPGAQVRADTILVELSNPELVLQAQDLVWQVRAAEASLRDLRVKLETNQLDLRATLARAESEFVQAKLKFDREEALAKEGLMADLNVRLARATAEELAKRFEIDRKRMEISASSTEAQLAVQQVQIEKLRAALALKQSQVEGLKVRAGADGVLQQLAVEVGKHVTPGTVLAKIAQPSRLKAEIRIPETQAKDVMIGQLAQIDTHNGVIPGRVVRIDPAAVSGNVTIDVSLDGALPPGARPDLSVDGVVELERLTSVVYVQRPVYGQANSLISLFKLTPDGKEANRVPVRIGRVSVQTVEILEGLAVGDRVVLSDMSAWDGHDRLRLN